MSVRVGFIGVGGIAIPHLINLVQNPDVEVVGLCDLSEERIDSARERVNKRISELNSKRGGEIPWLGGRAYTDLATMIRRESLDALYITLPPFAHGEPERIAIEAGVHLFVEKPVVLTIELAKEISSLIAERDLISSVGYQLRYSNLIDKARELLEGRTIGMVIGARCGSIPGTPWWTIQSKSGGQLVEQATHEIDLMRYLIGEIKTVYASAATRLLGGAPDFDIFDVNAMVLTFENGVVGTFANSCAASYGSPRGARGINILADGMGLSYSFSSLQVLTKGKEEEFKAEGDPMVAEDAIFVEAVKTGDPSKIRSPYIDAVRSLAVTLAGELSARSGRPVSVKEFS